MLSDSSSTILYIVCYSATSLETKLASKGRLRFEIGSPKVDCVDCVEGLLKAAISLHNFEDRVEENAEP